MKKITVLGAGMMGTAMAIDLSTEFTVSVVDFQKNEKLSKRFAELGIEIHHTDATDLLKLKPLIKQADLVIGAVPGFIGFKVLKNVIDCGKNIVDISFFNENPFVLHKEAAERNLTAVVDCGVSPGLSNMILGYHTAFMDVEYYECLVGGLPVKKIPPFQYSAPFSPIDVIEEYIRPARVVEDGKIIIKPPLSDLELIDIVPEGTLEAFNTDGLRTLVHSVNVPNMKEKTLRYPGHIEKIQFLKECGYFNTEAVEIEGIPIRPIDLSSKLLLPMWKSSGDDDEFTIMKIIIRGHAEGIRKEHVYHLYDRYDKKTGTSSMARTTGYTCTGAARLILAGKYAETGICPPEAIGKNNDCLEYILNHLASRNIKLNHIERDI